MFLKGGYVVVKNNLHIYLVFSFLPNQLYTCSLKCIHKKLPQVLNFPPGISYIGINNGFSFKFPYVWDPLLATLYALRTQTKSTIHWYNTGNQMKATVFTVCMFFFQ